MSMTKKKVKRYHMECFDCGTHYCMPTIETITTAMLAHNQHLKVHPLGPTECDKDCNK